MTGIASKTVMPSSVGELFAVRPPAVRDLALAARQLILGTLPGVDVRTQEQLRRPEVLQLLEMGLSAWRERSATAKEGKRRRSGSVT
jgi:hypothetical protein